ARDRATELWGPGVVTEIAPATEYWVGEEYHQDFFTKNPNQGYCNAVVLPKMAKVRQGFAQYLK
ncbi:MAG: peptide-methionine (S)-S-oxide reductase, partial [Micrococcales bacterium]